MAGLRVVIYYAGSNQRSRIIAKALAPGIRLGGDNPVMKLASTYSRPEHDVAIFYSLADGLHRVLADYARCADRHALFVDLGYWGRHKRTRWDGFHKICLNSRHPTAYFQRHHHPSDRFLEHGVEIRPWRKADPEAPVYVAGMSGKAAHADGFGSEEWERATVTALRKITKRRIIYRPKPNWHQAKPIPGTLFAPDEPLESVFARAHCIVTHHSNVGIDAVLAGVPVFCWAGAALPMACQDLGRLENPRMPAGREQWAADLAYTQWSVAEMSNGVAWRHIKRELLL